ncbi:MAG: tetratricopeptide repeat protein [Bacteroidia bacterium]
MKIKKFFCLSLILFLSCKLPAQKAEQDSLLKLLQTNLPDTARLIVLTQLTEILSDNNVWPQYNNQALKLAEKLISDSDSTVKRKATIALATAYNNEGLYYNLKGNATQALDFLLKSLELRRQLGSKSDLSEILHNLGTLYFDIKETDLAEQYFEKSLLLSQEINDSVNAAITLNYIGMIMLGKKNYVKALECFESTLHTFKNSNESENYAKSLDNIGTIYTHNKDWDRALSYFKEAERIQKGFDDPSVLSTTYKDIGTIFFFKGNSSEALKYATLALEQAEKSGFPGEIASAEQLLAKIYESKKDFTNAFYHYKKFIASHDSIKNEEARKAAIAEQLKSGYEKKAALVKAEQEKKDALATQEIGKQKILKNSFIAGAVMLLLVSLLLYNRFRLKRNSSEKLMKAYDDLKRTQEQLLHQEKMASLGQIAAGISHEIQNPLNFVNNFSAISAELIDEAKSTIDVNEKNEFLDVLKNNIDKISMHGNRASRIIKSILNQSHHSSNQKQLTDINQLCDEFVHLSFQGMKSNYPDFSCEIIKNLDPSNPNIVTAPQDIARVLLNLFNNAFYAVYEKSLKFKAESLKSATGYHATVELITHFTNSSVTISVKDNGKGIPEKIRQKIFEPFFTTKAAGNGTGLGLSISYDIIKMHGGDIAVNSRENEYSEFNISLPV